MSQMIEFDEAAARAVEAMYLTPDVVAHRDRVNIFSISVPGQGCWRRIWRVLSVLAAGWSGSTWHLPW